MATTRTGDTADAKFFRSSRIYTANCLWWFDTREGVQFGPFICKIGATCALAVYVAQHAHETSPDDGKGPRPGSQDGISHMVEEILEVLRQNRDFGRLAATNWAESRLEELRRSKRLTAEVLGRIRVLEFSLRHPEQAFDFDYFLRCRAG